MTDYLYDVSAFIAETGFADLPEAVVDRAHRVFADTLATIAAGACEPEVQALRTRMVADAGGPSSLIGTGLRTEPAKAAFLNATAGTFLELDEGNQFSRGHPGIHAIPAGLAWGEAHGCSGADVLTACVLGYEIGARIGIAAKILATMHPHGTWGTVGAAVTVARLASATQAQMRETINVASTLGLATSRQTMLQGGTVRNSFAGVSGQLGIMAWQMVESGITGEADGLSTIWGSVVSNEWRPEEMVRDLGVRWEIARNYFKRHACCRYNHGALDALAAIVERQGGLEAERVASVTVETYSLAAQLCDPSPKNTLAGKFSVPFAIATTLLNGTSGVESFTWDKIRDDRIQAFAGKVTVVEDPGLTAMMPDFRPARVRVALTDGTMLEAETTTNRGDTEDPYDDRELDRKYAELTDLVWSKAVAGAVYEDCFRLEALNDVNALTRHLDAVDLAAAGE